MENVRYSSIVQLIITSASKRTMILNLYFPVSWIHFCFISRNWQYKYVYRKTIENQHHASILEASHYLSV